MRYECKNCGEIFDEGDISIDDIEFTSYEENMICPECGLPGLEELGNSECEY